MIILYDKNEASFISNGLVVLNDCKACFITEELNGQYELELEYPIDSRGKWQYLVEGNILKADNQLYRIYRKIKTLTGIKINARHIFYDLLDSLVEEVDIRTLTGIAALNQVMSSTSYAHNYTYMSDINTVNKITLDDERGDIINKNPIEAIFFLISLYGGELVRDNHHIKWLQQRGLDRGVLISYGKNIKGIEEDIHIDDVITRIKPIGQDGLTLPEVFIDSPNINSFPYPKIKTIEFSDCNDYTSLREAVYKYYLDTKCDIPQANYKIDFIELSKTEEYKAYKVLESLYMGDTVTVRHSKLGIDLKCKVIRIKKNVLMNTVEEIELGNFKENLSDSFSQVSSTLQGLAKTIKLNKSSLQGAIDNATKLLTTSLGGYVVKKENEILIMDTQDESTATKVWRWNLNGLGYSGTGVNGPYRTAITMDGSIVADFITTGTLDAGLMKAGVLSNHNGTVQFDLDGNSFFIGDKLVYDGNSLQIKFSDTQSYKDKILEVEQNVNYKVEIYSTNGNVFKNNQISTTLKAKVYKGGRDITDVPIDDPDFVDANRYRWTRISDNKDADTIWNLNHIGGRKEITITQDDVNIRATFNCEIIDI